VSSDKAAIKKIFAGILGNNIWGILAATTAMCNDRSSGYRRLVIFFFWSGESFKVRSLLLHAKHPLGLPGRSLAW
jgi:hypothetical protein